MPSRSTTRKSAHAPFPIQDVTREKLTTATQSAMKRKRQPSPARKSSPSRPANRPQLSSGSQDSRSASASSKTWSSTFKKLKSNTDQICSDTTRHLRLSLLSADDDGDEIANGSDKTVLDWLNNMGDNDISNTNIGGQRLSMDVAGTGYNLARAATMPEIKKLAQTIRSFMDGAASAETLVSKPDLLRVGIDPDPFVRYLTSCSEKRPAVAVALFINTFALPEVARMGLCLRLFLDKQQLTTAAAAPTGDDESKRELTRKDVKTACERALAIHAKSTNWKKAASQNVEEAAVALDRLVGCKTFDPEVFLTYWLHGYYIPALKLRMFRDVACKHSRECSSAYDTTYARSDKQRLGSIFNTGRMREKALVWILPTMYKIKNGLTVATMDPLMDGIKGRSLTEKPVIYDALRFRNFKDHSLPKIIDAARAQHERGLRHPGLIVSITLRACAVAVMTEVVKQVRGIDICIASCKDRNFKWEGDSWKKLRNTVFRDKGRYYLCNDGVMLFSEDPWHLLSKHYNLDI